MFTLSRSKALAAATLIVVGCAKSDYVVPKAQRSSWRPVQDQRVADAKEAPAPKILPATHFSAGYLFEGQRQYEKAIFQYRKAIAVSHDYVEAYHRLGLMLSNVGRHGEAVDAFQHAVELSPDKVIYHNNLGFELMLLNRWVDAERELRTTIELSPQFERAHVNLGVVLARQGRFDEALTSFLHVLPDSDAYYNLGLLYRGQKKYDDAAAAFSHALELDPEFTAATAQLDQIAPFIETVESDTTVIEPQRRGVPVVETTIKRDVRKIGPTVDAGITIKNTGIVDPVTVTPHVTWATTVADTIPCGTIDTATVASADSDDDEAIDTYVVVDADMDDVVPVDAASAQTRIAPSVTSTSSTKSSNTRWNRTVTASDWTLASYSKQSQDTVWLASHRPETISAFTGQVYGSDEDAVDEDDSDEDELSFDMDGEMTDSVHAVSSAAMFSRELDQTVLVAHNEMSCWDELISEVFNPIQSCPNPDVYLVPAGLWSGSTGQSYAYPPEPTEPNSSAMPAQSEIDQQWFGYLMKPIRD